MHPSTYPSPYSYINPSIYPSITIPHPFIHPCSHHPSLYPSSNFTIHLPFNLLDRHCTRYLGCISEQNGQTSQPLKNLHTSFLPLVHSFIHSPIYLSIHPLNWSSINPYLPPFIHPPTSPYVFPLIFPSILHSSVHLSTPPPIFQPHSEYLHCVGPVMGTQNTLRPSPWPYCALRHPNGLVSK